MLSCVVCFSVRLYSCVHIFHFIMVCPCNFFFYEKKTYYINLICDFTVCFVFFIIAEEKKPLKGAEKNIIENKYLTVQKLSEEPI